MQNLVIVLTGLELLCTANAFPKVVSMQLSRAEPRSLSKRSTVGVDVLNEVNQAMYGVNVKVGNPPQQVTLLLDTASSDTWMFGPKSCDPTISPCTGGTFDISISSSGSVLQKGSFFAEYGTENSNVTGDFISDDFNFGGVTVKKLTMGLADQAVATLSGIMGVGFHSAEMSTLQGKKPYNNLLDEMVDQGLINSHSFSVWLDGLDATNGKLLYGGYDNGKFQGELAMLDMQASPQFQKGVMPMVLLTSVSLTDASGVTTALTEPGFSESVILDTGTEPSVFSQDLWLPLATSVNAVTSSGAPSAIHCSTLASLNSTLNFGFGGQNGPIIPVPMSELALPYLELQGNQFTNQDVSAACMFGIIPTIGSRDANVWLLGQVFLRSAYVLFDYDNQKIGIARTRLQSGQEAIVEISGAGVGKSNVDTVGTSGGSDGGLHGKGKGVLCGLPAFVAVAVAIASFVV